MGQPQSISGNDLDEVSDVERQKATSTTVSRVFAIQRFTIFSHAKRTSFAVRRERNLTRRRFLCAKLQTEEDLTVR